jgi:hypothetical protein
MPGVSGRASPPVDTGEESSKQDAPEQRQRYCPARLYSADGFIVNSGHQQYVTILIKLSVLASLGTPSEVGLAC